MAHVLPRLEHRRPQALNERREELQRPPAEERACLLERLQGWGVGDGLRQQSGTGCLQPPPVAAAPPPASCVKSSGLQNDTKLQNKFYKHNEGWRSPPQ